LSNNEQPILSHMDGAYISGLMMGWAARLQKESEPASDVINDMNEFAKELAVRSGVTLFENKD